VAVDHRQRSTHFYRWRN